MKKEKNITRCDYERVKGWNVRIYDKRKLAVSKMFSDSIYGGKSLALKAAIKFRNDQYVLYPSLGYRAPNSLEDMPAGRITRKWVFQRASWSDVYEAYIKWGPKPNQHAVTKWSIAVWGAKEAKRRCEIWLERWRKKQVKNYQNEVELRRKLREKHATSRKIPEVQRFENGWRVVLDQNGFSVRRLFEDDRLGAQGSKQVAEMFRRLWLGAPKFKSPRGTVTWSLYWTGDHYEAVWMATSKGKTFRRLITIHGYDKARDECMRWLRKQ